MPLGVFAAVLAALLVAFPFQSGSSFFSLAWRGALAGIPVAVLGLRTLREMTR